jgi:hypothetical protein
MPRVLVEREIQQADATAGVLRQRRGDAIELRRREVFAAEESNVCFMPVSLV